MPLASEVNARVGSCKARHKFAEGDCMGSSTSAQSRAQEMFVINRIQSHLIIQPCPFLSSGPIRIVSNTTATLDRALCFNPISRNPLEIKSCRVKTSECTSYEMLTIITGLASYQSRLP